GVLGPSLTGPRGEKGEDGHSPVLTWVGDQISIDGILGPHLTGPKGNDGRDGSDGREIELSIDDYIRWRYAGETSWRNLIAVNELKGQDGKDGRELEITKSPTHIQFRYVGDTTWRDLVPLSELKGDKGDPGEDAKEIEFLVENGFIRWRREGEAWQNLIPLSELKGADGRDGEEIVLGTSPTHILWKYRSDENWIELISFEQLKGEKGEDGLTPYIGENGNWWIGSIDMGIKAQGPDGSPGREIELRKTGTHIQWRYVGESNWTNLVSLEEIKGPPGDSIDLEPRVIVIENFLPSLDNRVEVIE